MIEIIASLIFISYAVIGVVYSVKMENDTILKQSYKARSDRDWAEICFAVGFAWPVATFVHYIMRRRNETA